MKQHILTRAALQSLIRIDCYTILFLGPRKALHFNLWYLGTQSTYREISKLIGVSRTTVGIWMCVRDNRCFAWSWKKSNCVASSWDTTSNYRWIPIVGRNSWSDRSCGWMPHSNFVACYCKVFRVLLINISFWSRGTDHFDFSIFN